MKLACHFLKASIIACLMGGCLQAADQDGTYSQSPGKVPANSSLIKATAEITPLEAKISFTVAAGEGSPTAWHHIYINTDANSATGFLGSANPVACSGMDFLVEPKFLYQWGGEDDQRGWHWNKVEPVQQTVEGRTVTYTFPTSSLSVKPGAVIHIFIETMNENYVQTIDILPREKTPWEVKVKSASSEEKAAAALKSEKALVAANPQARELFKKINNYACYYGGSGAVESLSKKDAVIVETRNLKAEDVAAIKKNGTLVIGYISAGEDDKLRVGDGKGPGGYDSRYLSRKHPNVPDKNGDWNSYYVDPGSASWRSFFLEQARNMIKSYGVDGFFLDTIETVTVYPDLKPSMISLLQDLRTANPKAIIVLNRGFDVVRETVGFTDGFMFEDFSAGHYFDKRGYVFHDAPGLDARREQAESFLVPLHEKNGLVVLALDYAATEKEPYLKDAYDRAKTFGFIPYASTFSLDAFFNIDYVGKINPKWKTELSDPEALSIVLADKINGFPKGTKVTPSSDYADYTVAPVVDGIRDRSKLDWRTHNWASREKGGSAHYLEFHFPTPVQFKQIIIDWATDNGEAFPSRKFALEIAPVSIEKMPPKQTTASNNWKRVWETTENGKKRCAISLNQEKISSFRIFQDAGGGSTARPNLMWVEQVQIVE